MTELQEVCFPPKDESLVFKQWDCWMEIEDKFLSQEHEEPFLYETPDLVPLHIPNIETSSFIVNELRQEQIKESIARTEDDSMIQVQGDFMVQSKEDCTIQIQGE